MGGALGFGAFLAGALELAVLVFAVVAAGWLATERCMPALTGAVKTCAVGILALLGLIASEVLPLLFGLLTRGAPPIVAVLLLGAAALATRGKASAPGRTVPFARPGLSNAMSALGLVAVLSVGLAYLETILVVHVNSIDALAFHLPGVIGYVQSGSLWHISQYLPNQAQANYPQNGDMILLALTLPWHALAFVRYGDVLMLGLGGLAIYAAGVELGAPRSTSVLVALSLIVTRPVLQPAMPDTLTDPTFVAGFACGMLFLIRHGATGARSDLALAAIGLGIAFGTKWYGLSDVPALILAWALFRYRQVGAAGLGRELALVIGCVLGAGGVWLLRNLVLTGNPVFDYKVTLFGATIFAAPPNPLRTRIGFSLAHYATDLSVLRHYVWPALRSDFGIPGGLIVVGAAVSATRFRRDPRFPMLALGGLLCAVAYFVTPYSAQGLPGAPTLIDVNTRYGVAALVLGAPLLAVAVARAGSLRLPLELLLLASVMLDLHRYLPVGGTRIVATAAGLVAVAVVLLAIARWAPRPRRVHALAASLAVLGCALAGAAFHYARVLAAQPYLPPDPTIAYVDSHAPAHTHIGLTGSWVAYGLVPPAPLFGPRFENTVTYVGPFEQHRLHEYTTRSAFVAALRRGRYPLLEVGTGYPAHVHPLLAVWASEAGYAVVTRSARLILMRRVFTS